MTNAVLIYTTFPNVDAAEAVADDLLSKSLIACANVLTGMQSIYRWNGATEKATEVVMLLKTASGLSSRVVAAVEAGHPYETPAIFVIDVASGSAPFLHWIGEVTADARNKS